MNNIEEMRVAYLFLVRTLLPFAAKFSNRYPVKHDHCFSRILLDYCFEDCWYNHLTKGGKIPTYKQLNEEQLNTILFRGTQYLIDPNLCIQDNIDSLIYRTGKFPSGGIINQN